MSKFSSLKFMELYTKGKLLFDIRASRLQSGNDVYDDIIDCLEEIIDLINADGGWVVYGWGKQGVVNDIVMLGNESNKDQGVDTKVLSEHISTHVVHMHPANIDYLDPVTVRGKQLEELKYDFSSLSLNCKIAQAKILAPRVTNFCGPEKGFKHHFNAWNHQKRIQHIKKHGGAPSHHQHSSTDDFMASE